MEGEKFNFITGSSYSGSFIRNTHTMHGFGVYNYADGTEYRGNFKCGHFHGFGRIKFPPPKNFLLFGYFENGDLVKTEEMFFSDGLRFKGDIINDREKLELSTDTWKHCTEQDRRYTRERIYGLDALLPSQRLTCDVRARELPKDTYDTEEGILKGSTGFVVDIHNSPYNHRFVNCRDELEWLKKNCRKSTLTENDKARKAEIPMKEFREKIMKLNIKFLLQMGLKQQCECNLEKELAEKLETLNLDDQPSTSAAAAKRLQNLSKASLEISDKSSTKSSAKVTKKDSVPSTSNYARSSSSAISTKSSKSNEHIIKNLNKSCKLELKNLKMKVPIVDIKYDSDSDDDEIRRRSTLN